MTTHFTETVWLDAQGELSLSELTQLSDLSEAELRELVAVPIASACSTTTTSRPDTASALATASPTTPAPATTQSIVCMASLSVWSDSLEHFGAADPDASYAKIVRQRNDIRRRAIGPKCKSTTPGFSATPKTPPSLARGKPTATSKSRCKSVPA